MPEFLDLLFRPSPRYRLARFEQLGEVTQDSLRDLTRASDFYGVLVPEGDGGLVPKAVSKETALLLYSLGKGSPIPGYYRAQEDDTEEVVRGLLLDGILEVKQNGEFIGGSVAEESLRGEITPQLGGDAVSRLSLEAIRYAERLHTLDATALSARLYFYNRLPMTPDTRLRFRAERKVRHVLQLGKGEAVGDLLQNQWIEKRLLPPNDGWLMWQCENAEKLDAENSATYKLYISPALSVLPQVFAATVRVLTKTRTPRLKVGRNALGLLRPDKIVAYFRREEHLMETAQHLLREAAGAPAHGVPFSAPIHDEALLSWGVDPPKMMKTLSWQETETWRLWLTNRIAVALLQARGEGAGLPAWKFALRRLDHLGVDLKTWRLRPGSAQWEQP